MVSYSASPDPNGLTLALALAAPYAYTHIMLQIRYSRYTIAIPTYKSLTSEGAAQLFWGKAVGLVKRGVQLIHERGLWLLLWL